MKLLYNEEQFSCTKTKLLNFKLTLPLAKSVMVRGRLTSNDLIFSRDTMVDIQFVTFFLLSNISELSIGTKTKIWQVSSPVKYILPNKKLNPFVNNNLTFSNSSIDFFSTSPWFVLFEVTLLLIFFSFHRNLSFLRNQQYQTHYLFFYYFCIKYIICKFIIIRCGEIFLLFCYHNLLSE